MSGAIYMSAAGAMAYEKRMQIISNNLANRLINHLASIRKIPVFITNVRSQTKKHFIYFTIIIHYFRYIIVTPCPPSFISSS